MVEQKFKKGDKVRIINYGHKIWHSKNGYAQQASTYTAFQRLWELKLFYGKDYKEDFNSLIIDENIKPNHILKETEDLYICDLSPEMVGKEGIIEGSYADFIESGSPGFAGGSRNEQNSREYSLTGISGKSAWYDEEQLELI